MQQRYANILLLIFFAGLSNLLFAQASFTATVSPTVIGKNETAELKLMIENASKPESILTPALNNFIIVSGPSQQSGMVTINGRTTNYVGYVYIIRPKAKGTFTIPSTTAKADGNILKSNPVKIKVVEEATGNAQGGSASPFGGFGMFDEPQPATNYSDFVLKKGENVQEKVSRNLFIKVFTDKTSCYVGEPIVATYKLYTRLKSESNIAKSPAFNNFSVLDLVQPQFGANYKVEKLNGREYNVYIIRKAQLYPLQAGMAELETASVDNNVHFIKEEYLQQLQTDVFGEPIPGSVPAGGRHDEKITVESKPVQIEVKPLPENGRPVSFSGAVGNFMIDGFVEKDSLSADDAGKLKILLSGEGNMVLLPAPEVAWPKGLEGYEPVTKEGLNRLAVPVSGSKIFEYSFTASKEGSYTIPPVVFSYFDIDSGKYKSVSTKPFVIHIAKGTGKRPAIAANTTGMPESFARKIFSRRWMIIVPVALIILISLLLWLRGDKRNQKEKLAAALKQQEQEKEKEIEIEDARPANPLAQSEIMLMQNNARLFYETLDKELHAYYAQTLKLPAESISKKTIADALDKTGASIEKNLAVQKLLGEISLQLYTPFADESRMQEFYLEAVRLARTGTL